MKKITYKITCNDRIFTDEGRLLTDVLQNLCKKCIETGDTGYFFRLEDVNLNILYKNPKFHIVNTINGEFGIVIDELVEEIPGRNIYLCALRAKRELYGLSLPEMSELVDKPDYKQRESGSRDMTLSEYVRFMQALDEYYEDRVNEQDNLCDTDPFHDSRFEG